MRSREFLKLISEASVFKTTKNQYVPGYRMSLSGSQDGLRTTGLIKAQVPDFNPAEELTIAALGEPASVSVVLPGKAEKSFSLKRANGQVIELQGSKSSIQSSLNGIGPGGIDGEAAAPKAPNKGDTAEGLLGAAMFAKLRKREGSGIGAVTLDDVWEVFDRMTPVADTDYMVTAKDMGGATDKIWFRLKVKSIVKNALSNPDLRKKLSAWAMSPVNYANSKQGTEYADQFYKNGQPDEIGIISDGLSAQTDRKSDVFTVVRDPITGNVAKELLPISLKAGAEQFAQHSGSSFKAMSKMFSRMGIQLTANQKTIYDSLQQQGRPEEAVYGIYTIVAKQFNETVVGDTAEAKFISQLATALDGWATGGMPNVQLVSFGSRGAFEVLQFNNLVPKMKTLDLEAVTVWGENPKLIIKDRTQGTLFHIRTYMQTKDDGTKYQRNVIEKGPLLGKIANALEQEPTASAPVDKAPVKPADLPASIQNQNKQIGTKIPMGQEPIPVPPQ
jgi:hypothetical protein